MTDSTFSASDLKSDDKMLLQRSGSSYFIFLQQLLDYQLEGISDENSGLQEAIDEERKEREHADQELELALQAYKDFVRMGVDLLFPSLFEEKFANNAFLIQQTFFNTFYQELLNNIDSGLDGQDRIDAETEALYDTVKTIYADLGAFNLDKQFAVLCYKNKLGDFKETHTLFVDTTAADTGTNIDWESLRADDFLSISDVDDHGQASSTHYGMYKVIKNLSADFGPNGDASMPDVQGIKVLHVVFEGGNIHGNYYPNNDYIIRGMSEFRSQIDGDYVAKAGDTMTGTLAFDTTTAINLPRSENQVITKLSDDIILRMASGDINVKSDKTITGIADPDENVLSSAVNVGFLDSKIVVVDSKLDDIIADLAVTDQRVDAIGKIRDQYDFNIVNLNHSDDLATWTTKATTDITSGEVRFFDKDLTETDIGGGANQRIVISKTDANTGGVFLDTAEPEDLVEFYCLDGVPSTVVYKILSITGTGTYYTIDGTFNAKFGEQTLQENKIYKMKYFAAQDGLTIQEADDRYVVKSDNVVIPGEVNVKPGDPNQNRLLKVSHADTNNEKFEVVKDATARVTSGLDTGKFLLRSNLSNGYFTNALTYRGIEYSTTTTDGFRIFLEDSTVLTIKGATTDLHQHLLTGLSLSNGANPKDAVSVEYFNTKLATMIVAGENINVTPLDDGRVQITGVVPEDDGTFASLSDVGKPGDDWEHGDTIMYDGSLGRFVQHNLEDTIKGKSLMAQSEAEASVGGFWTDGTNFFIRVQ